jgi:hypothetical protein
MRLIKANRGGRRGGVRRASLRLDERGGVRRSWTVELSALDSTVRPSERKWEWSFWHPSGMRTG